MENQQNGVQDSGQTEETVTVNTGKVLSTYRLSPGNDSEFKRRAKTRNVTQDQLLAHLLRVDTPTGEQQQDAAPLPPQLSAIDEALSIIREQARAFFVTLAGTNETIQRSLDAETALRRETELKCMASQRDVERMAEELNRVAEERDALIQQARNETEAARQEAEAAKLQARQMTAALTASQEQVQALETRLLDEKKKADAEIDSLKTRAAMVTDAENRNEELRRKATELEAEISSLKKQKENEVRTARSEEKMAASEKIERLLTSLSRKDDDVSELRNQIHQLRTEMEDSRRTVESQEIPARKKSPKQQRE